MYVPIIDSINTYITFTLLGLIWTIQWVHYPSFYYISKAQFNAFEKFHTQKITWIVAPLMVVEFFVSALLLFLLETSLKYQIGFTLVVLIWLCTFFLSVPCHKKLMLSMDEKVIQRLIVTNWWRTILWSVKALCVALL